MAKGKAWYKAMPFVCATVARHVYHCLKFQEPYNVEKAFGGSALSPASEQALVDFEAGLDERFEVMEARLVEEEG
jgi:hypothetical protein